MSALAGIWYYDGRPLVEADLHALAVASQPEGPDGGGTVRPLPGLALQAHRLQFDRLSATERQPYFFGQGSVLTWDGRLDNRDDLLLTVGRCLGADRSDAALVAAAYARWELACLPRLLGDWSLALWDGAKRTLVLARDYSGTRPLYYLERPGGLAWATCLEALASCFDLYGRPDETYIAAKFASHPPPELTPFEGVRNLGGGHVLMASAASRAICVRRYWTFEPTTLRYRAPHAYTDHLRWLLREAVRVRLRAERTVWAHLSGGWDSSSVVCLAHTLIEHGEVDAPALRVVSGIHSETPEADDSGYMEAVERWCGLASLRREWGVRNHSFAELAGYRQPFPGLPAAVLEAPIAAAGDRVIISGAGGDDVMMQSESHRMSMLEPLYDGHLLKYLQLSFALSRHERRPLLGTLVWPLLFAHVPQVIYKRLAIWRAGRDPIFATAKARYPPLFGVTPALRARAPERRIGYVVSSVAGFPRVKRWLVNSLYAEGDYGGSLGTLSGLCHTTPYRHRPLVEFILAVPQLAMWNPTIMRLGMRRALTDVLPPEILARTAKGHAQVAANRDLRRWAAVVADAETDAGCGANWHIVRRGYVEAGALRQVFDNLLAREDPPGFFGNWFYIEAWLRTLAALPRRSNVSGSGADSSYAPVTSSAVAGR